jgi:hypothetical protein
MRFLKKRGRKVIMAKTKGRKYVVGSESPVDRTDRENRPIRNNPNP